MGVAACSFLAFPLGGKVPPKGADEGSEFGCLVGRDDSARCLSGIVCAGIFRRSGGELLCPRRLVVAMAQATFSWPFGPIHLESACLRFRLAAKTAPAPLFLLFPANPLRWASPGVTMDWAKRHRGRLRMSASRSYSPSLSPLAFGHLPLTRGVGPGPQYGGRVPVGMCNISGAWKSEWLV